MARKVLCTPTLSSARGAPRQLAHAWPRHVPDSPHSASRLASFIQVAKPSEPEGRVRGVELFTPLPPPLVCSSTR